MKNALFSCLALLLLAFLMMPAQANAHGLEQHENSAPSYEQADQAQAALAIQERQTYIVKVSVDKNSTKTSCNGNCCSSAACCAAILAAKQSSKPEVIRSVVKPMALRGLAPLGPPHPLFRPPRISA